MNDTLYKIMNWPEIEAVCYAEHDNPHQLLGAHKTDKGVLVQCFFPDAIKVTLNRGDEKIEMEKADDMGFFAVLVPSKEMFKYTFTAEYEKGSETVKDPYNFDPIIPEADRQLFSAGINYKIYEYLGAHPMKVDGVNGVLFAVWAPNCMRVSVVGNFNNWDGRKHPMRRLGDSGIFELFIPDIAEGEIYKYELKNRGGLTYLKADPYASASELRPGTASKVADLNSFTWNDDKWLKERTEGEPKEKPMLIYEVHLGSWKKPSEENGCFYSYRELAPMLAKYVKDYGYTHIELMPVMEHPLDASWGYQVTGYYSPTARYGTPQDFMYFMNYMHEQGIGVILDWVPAHFPRDTFGLSNFDGTCLYEHLDPRQGSHPHWGTLIYNYGRPQVSNFLIANALYWVEKFHADGIRMDAVASMLYLDYGKNDGEWVANIYGGKENLEAIELIKHLNSIMKKRNPGALMIAEESTAWPKITGDLDDGGLGFDFKWNMGWMNDFTTYMRQDPLFRRGCHGMLTFSMMYAYSENFVLVLSHDEVVHGKGSMFNKMPGFHEDKLANLKATYGFMMCHPGKKLLFMGQEFGQEREWSEERSLDWFLLKDNAIHQAMDKFSRDLFGLYTKYPALYKLDQYSDGFEWMSCMDADHSMVSFVRRTENPDDTLYIICNFTPVVYEKQAVAVPFNGKYKEIFNSDDVKYGGAGHTNTRMKQSKAVKVDGRENSIEITIPPLGFAIFTATKIEPAKKTEKKQSTAKASASKKKQDNK
ncbi:MAG: 1,4-alpha-glucan branching protein GlgB [Lachnospiraceae bacterium]|nr:1,4-alpha-glucan branching protein GlgB [Lachnospiraceae bacterium]